MIKEIREGHMKGEASNLTVRTRLRLHSRISYLELARNQDSNRIGGETSTSRGVGRSANTAYGPLPTGPQFHIAAANPIVAPHHEGLDPGCSWPRKVLTCRGHEHRHLASHAAEQPSPVPIFESNGSRAINFCLSGGGVGAATRAWQTPEKQNLKISEMIQVVVNACTKNFPEAMLATLYLVMFRSVPDPVDDTLLPLTHTDKFPSRSRDWSYSWSPTIPAGFHVTVQADGAEVADKNKAVHVDQDDLDGMRILKMF
ncbi:uncharacterized protein EDB91DRAFT_1337250 [Suillus paluster]|uniref:uncharacterized protein n=1 Tax=Suillus paluster TaxID=48578 RepID=UPI001B88357B|nr:uncharacterized protein EDB91DRAFT_1337250 [Suillus paluster]KAG1737565.1 hypothetical protein EDB91DRAFT_1337250 [Suillus paluster]